MFKLINGLTVNNRLRIISLLLLVFTITCGLLIWNLVSSFRDDRMQNNALLDSERVLWQIRNECNGMRGDLMFIFITDPASQSHLIEERAGMFNQRSLIIPKLIASVQANVFNPDIQHEYKVFKDMVSGYVSFCQKNLEASMKSQLSDTVEYLRTRETMIIMDGRFQEVREQSNTLFNGLQSDKLEIRAEREKALAAKLTTISLISVVLLGLVLFVILVISRSILTPIRETEDILYRLSAGELPSIRDYTGKDEFSRMLRSLKTFNGHIHRLMGFVSQVSQNNFQVQADMFEGKGPIAVSLTEMRDNLQIAYKSEAQRTWRSQGMAQLGEVLRQQRDLRSLYDNVLSFIVRYVSAQHGALYVLDNEEENLELMATYAYGKKKFVTATLAPGQGMVGQAFLEKDMIILKDIPPTYIKITSGLGESLPRCLVISPLITNDTACGVLEIASFEVMEPHTLDLLKRISEELAAIIISARGNAKTQRLLEESQQQAEELKAQEEEVRQNMEELQATQEGMSRLLTEVQSKEDFFLKILDTIQAPILVLDHELVVLQVNRGMKRRFSNRGQSISVGQKLTDVLSERSMFNLRPLVQRAMQGETVRDEHHPYVDFYSGIRNEEGTITGVVQVSFSLSEESVQLISQSK
jgi:PAS domain-containing protein